ncbi:hypothetical protein HK100_011756 [Physocladia obscura]|uniref:C2H2-type domain-containing protein n=1 Tax=Physocladia obscura TaxID=109957 RepID=A0AAD5XGR3_9FUNG|nr:hypothetical protein HK100_011756 [Physocladia obscura]
MNRAATGTFQSPRPEGNGTTMEMPFGLPPLDNSDMGSSVSRIETPAPSESDLESCLLTEPEPKILRQVPALARIRLVAFSQVVRNAFVVAPKNDADVFLKWLGATATSQSYVPQQTNKTIQGIQAHRMQQPQQTSISTTTSNNNNNNYSYNYNHCASATSASEAQWNYFVAAFGAAKNPLATLQSSTCINTDSYFCAICGLPYKSFPSATHHIKTVHYKERRFKCDGCGKLWQTNNRLTVHMRSHSNEKPYNLEV